MEEKPDFWKHFKHFVKEAWDDVPWAENFPAAPKLDPNTKFHWEGEENWEERMLAEYPHTIYWSVASHLVKRTMEENYRRCSRCRS